MRRLVTIAVGLGLGSTAIAEPSVWRECRIDGGRIGACPKRATGDGVAFHAGAYRWCRFDDGRLAGCTRRFSGVLALADSDGVYRECEVRSGRQSTCASRFTGTKIVGAD